MVRRRGTPSPTWRSFLRNQAQGIAAIDMFVVASVSFRLFYVMIILGHDRRKIIRTAVTEHPTAAWLSRRDLYRRSRRNRCYFFFFGGGRNFGKCVSECGHIRSRKYAVARVIGHASVKRSRKSASDWFGASAASLSRKLLYHACES